MMLKNDVSIGKQLCEIFGIDPKVVTSITIEILPESKVYVTIGRITYIDEMNKTMEVLKEYTLVKNDTTPFISGNDNLETLK